VRGEEHPTTHPGGEGLKKSLEKSTMDRKKIHPSGERKLKDWVVSKPETHYECFPFGGMFGPREKDLTKIKDIRDHEGVSEGKTVGQT